MYKICPNCKKRYVYNPDVGQGIVCPYFQIKNLKSILK